MISTSLHNIGEHPEHQCQKVSIVQTTIQKQNTKYMFLYLKNQNKKKTATQKHNIIINVFFQQSHAKHKNAIKHARANLMQK